MAARSTASRKARLDALRLAANPLPPDLSDTYIINRLLRVREQIDRLDNILGATLDPNKIERLCSAIYRLQDMERVLAGRPSPGTTRRDGPAPPAPRSPLPTPR